ncbi:MAG: hypothetical protein IJM91_05545 [Lachnospiraceae bacterium]|nr:hypothetical protein [Lachnospiraceae bacterium]
MRLENEMDAIMAFLDAETYDAKFDVLRMCEELATDHMIDTMAASLDTVIKPGPIYERFDELKSIVLTNKKYEVLR